MAINLIAGMPAAGKDTLAELISKETGGKVVSMSRDILKPLLKDKYFRNELSRLSGLDLSRFSTNRHPLCRERLILLGDDLNKILRKSHFHHFSDLARLMYGDSIIIPSFRQKEMLYYLDEKDRAYTTILIHCKKETRYERWSSRDGIALDEMGKQDEIEYMKYVLPLMKQVDFDYVVNNSGEISCLENFVCSKIR